jgi:hypothetical protein
MNKNSNKYLRPIQLAYPHFSFSRAQNQQTECFRKAVSNLPLMYSQEKGKVALFLLSQRTTNGKIQNAEQQNLTCMEPNHHYHQVVNMGSWDRSVVLSDNFRIDRHLLKCKIRIV